MILFNKYQLNILDSIFLFIYFISKLPLFVSFLMNQLHLTKQQVLIIYYKILCNLTLLLKCPYAHKWLIIHKTLRLCANKEYELKWAPMGLIGKYWLLYNQILKFTQHSTKVSQLHFIILWNYIEMKLD